MDVHNVPTQGRGTKLAKEISVYRNAGDALMKAKQIAAALAGLCLMWGTAQAGNGNAQQPNAASPVEAPEAVGATNGVVILEIGPAQGSASAEEIAAMQLLLLQLLMMQSEGGANAEMIDVQRAPTGVGI